MDHDAFEARRDGNHSVVRLGVAKRTPGKIKSKRTKKRSSREQHDASDPLDQNPSQGNNRRHRFSRERKCKQEHQTHSTEQEISHRSSAQRKRRSSSLSRTEAFQTRDRSKNYQSHTKTSRNNISVLEQLNSNPKITPPLTVDLCNVDDDNENESYDANNNDINENDVNNQAESLDERNQIACTNIDHDIHQNNRRNGKKSNQRGTNRDDDNIGSLEYLADQHRTIHSHREDVDSVAFGTKRPTQVDHLKAKLIDGHISVRQKKKQKQIKSGSMHITIPSLKQSSASNHASNCRRQPKTRTPHQMDANTDDCNDTDDNEDKKRPSDAENDGSSSIMDVVNAAASSDSDFLFDENQRTRKRNDTASAEVVVMATSSNPNSSFSISSLSSLQLKKVNTTQKRKARAKVKGNLIVPGQTIQNSSKNYIVESKGTYAGDEASTNWNPITGKRYGHGYARQTNASNSSSLTLTSSTRSNSDHSFNKSKRANASQEIQSTTIRSSRRKKKSDKTPETIDITNSDSEDDDTINNNDDQEDDNCIHISLKRLAYNNQIYNHEDHQVKLKYDIETSSMTLTLNKSRLVSRSRIDIVIDMENAEELIYFDDDKIISTVTDIDLDSFLFFKAVPTLPNRRSTRKKGRFVLEFEDDAEFITLMSCIEDSGSCPTTAQPNDIQDYAQPLIMDSEKKFSFRNQTTPNKTDSFVSNMKSDDILLTYPLKANKDKIEAAVLKLRELSYKADDRERFETKSQSKHDAEAKDTTTSEVNHRSHHIVIRVDDYERLEPGQWLNDSLVDLWMQWISRDINCKQSDVHFFTSHFYSTLVKEGTKGVKSWTARKNINIFEKKLVFIPINKTLHWSLCVIVNPGAIQISDDDACNANNEDQPVSCILFFDSLKMHSKSRAQKKLVGWLNFEWKQIKKSSSSPFKLETYQIYDPEVPRQNNGSDCGVFVCRYALAMLKLRTFKFTKKEAGIEDRNDEFNSNRTTRQNSIHKKNRNGKGVRIAFTELITHGKHFDFDYIDIRHIREEFQAFIRNLHPLYIEANKIKIEKEEEDKKARRELRRQEKMGMTVQSSTVSVVTKQPCDLAKSSPRNITNDSGASGKENVPYSQVKPRIDQPQIELSQERNLKISQPEVPSENDHMIENSKERKMSNPRAEESSKSVHSKLEQREQHLPKNTLPMDSPPEKEDAMENANGMESSTITTPLPFSKCAEGSNVSKQKKSKKDLELALEHGEIVVYL